MRWRPRKAPSLASRASRAGGPSTRGCVVPEARHRPPSSRTRPTAPAGPLLAPPAAPNRLPAAPGRALCHPGRPCEAPPPRTAVLEGDTGARAPDSAGGERCSPGRPRPWARGQRRWGEAGPARRGQKRDECGGREAAGEQAQGEDGRAREGAGGGAGEA
ncbi:uncharacterized protein [Manis javanica]|uniref:uncharacterized protein isoform X3 n=1 Tax=Manis javanica TaxID=9974 RepID=UPI003C6DA3FB